MNNIALCTDERFVIPALTCITSIFENNKDDKLAVYVLTEGVSASSKKKFELLGNAYNRNINVLTINSSSFSGLVVRDPFPVSMYFRFLLPEILKDEDKVLYLDCDIIVRHSLRGLFEINLTDKACAVVEDQHGDDVTIRNRTHTSAPYFNSGVMLMNLDYWRRNNTAKELIDYIYKNPDKCFYPDQDALNIVLENKVVYLPYSYNCQHFFVTSTTWSKLHYTKSAEIKRQAEDPVILHFCHKDKPWHVSCSNPRKGEFFYYNSLHSFIGNPLKHKLAKTVLRKIFNRIGLKMFALRDTFR